MTASVFGDKLSSGNDGFQAIGAVAAKLVGIKLDRKVRARLGRGDSPRSGEPVWRNSYTRGQIEDRVWKPIHDGTKRGGARWTRALLKRARELEFASRLKRREKTPGSENGVIGHVGLEVLQYMFSIVDYATGRLEPAIATIAEAIGRSYSATHRALVRLREAGFLRWMRRSEPIKDPEPDGPRIKQISNAYALLVPEAMRNWLSRLLRPAPVPSCAQDRIDADRAEIQRIAAGMTAGQWQAAFGASYNGDVLASLARALDARIALTANPPVAEKPGDHSDP